MSRTDGKTDVKTVYPPHTHTQTQFAGGMTNLETFSHFKVLNIGQVHRSDAEKNF